MKCVSSIPISVEPADIFRDLVLKKRGGYCFQQNSLMALALRSLGYNVVVKAARVLLDQPSSSLTHILLLVSHPSAPEQIWLVDVGFGGFSPLLPLPLNKNSRTKAKGGHTYFIGCRNDVGLVTGSQREVWALGVFTPQPKSMILYEFDISTEFLPVDISLANYYVCTHPQSIFVNHLFVSGIVRHEDGTLKRVSLWDGTKSECFLSDSFQEKTYSILLQPTDLFDTFSSIGLSVSLELCDQLIHFFLSQTEDIEIPPNV